MKVKRAYIHCLDTRRVCFLLYNNINIDKTKIRLLVTGGTIDHLDYTKEENTPKKHLSLIPNLLKQARISVDCEIEILMQKDSRVITENDRRLILDRCINCAEKRILIIHGTFTMPETAKYIGKNNLDKTIILFGSAIPANKEFGSCIYGMSIITSWRIYLS